MRYYSTTGDAVDLCPACAADRSIRIVHDVDPDSYNHTEGREAYAENADAGDPSTCDACDATLTVREA